MHRRHFLKTTATSALAPLVASPLLTQNQQEKNPNVDTIRSRIKPITTDERTKRIERAKELMTRENIDALLIEGGVTMNYFTGINWGRSERLFAMILPRNGEPAYVAPKFEEGRAQEQVGTARLLTWEEDESPYDLIKQVLKDSSLLTATIGIEESTRSFVSENVGRTLASAKFVSGTPVTAGCRCVKSGHEIELMQIANDITAEVFKSALQTLREGMTEKEFASTISRLFSQFGVGGGALVLFGEASAYPHGLVKEHTLHENQIVLIDGGCSVEGYSSDITRTTVFGTPSDKMKKVWEIVRDAQSAALKAARPGVPAESIDAAARAVITDAGYGPDYKYFTHRLGHGIGLEGHEWYYLVRGNTRPERAGETHSNEPGIYIVGEFGIRLEDEMLIMEDAAKLLLPQAKSLEDIF
ncbi:MAG: aminopeptidase P family protein [Ignavibacteriae bacterium]|nr:aminopeptidase P family protein [Ignavibacteria bacterium]MBI3365835.1 aminopeptidase P family protein [Ignavibacteriota bacterium]